MDRSICKNEEEFYCTYGDSLVIPNEIVNVLETMNSKERKDILYLLYEMTQERFYQDDETFSKMARILVYEYLWEFLDLNAHGEAREEFLFSEAERWKEFEKKAEATTPAVNLDNIKF